MYELRILNNEIFGNNFDAVDTEPPAAWPGDERGGGIALLNVGLDVDPTQDIISRSPGI